MEEKGTMSRKDKRKAVKKTKRQMVRQERALKLRHESEASLNDPNFLLTLRLMEQEEAQRSLRERNAFEERERAWLEAMALKAATTTTTEQDLENDNHDHDDWEYVEQGPPEIIWQGNEIILRKKKIRVPKMKDTEFREHADVGQRPISNPFPPEPEAGPGHSSVTAQDLLPSFGTEQDKAHCPFHMKTGACRFGQRCSRVHFYLDKSCTLLIKNMYNGPGLAWDHDEGLEHTDEEVERTYEEFYDDVHTEFLKFGEIVNFKVCRNASSHLRGNVYVHFKSLDSAVLAYQSINGRYFAGKQVSCEFVNVSRWKIAICGEYMKTRFKTCSRGSACNFIHCFCNPGGDYEWANNDNPPPRHWVKKMIALFGYSDDETSRERQTLLENRDQPNGSRKISTTDMDRHRLRRSRSRETDYVGRSSSSRRRKDEEHYVQKQRDHRSHTSYDRVDNHSRNDEDRKNLKENPRVKKRTRRHDTEESFGDDGEICENEYHDHKQRSSEWNSGTDQNDFRDHKQRSSRYLKKTEMLVVDYTRNSREWSDEEHGGDRRSSRRKRSRSYKEVEKSKDYSRERNADGVSDLSDVELENRYSRKYISKEDLRDGNLELEKCGESNYSRRNDERYVVSNLDSRCKSDMDIIEHDRWEPEPCSFELQ